jgi:hypothetical protein
MPENIEATIYDKDTLKTHKDLPFIIYLTGLSVSDLTHACIK